MKFDSKETEDYYYLRLAELRIEHVTVNKDSVYTMDDVIEMTDELEKVVHKFMN